MRVRRIPDSDSLFRHSLFPVSFRSTNNLNKTRFAYEKLMRVEEDKSDGSLHTSLAWERYVPTSKYVHGYGCRTASRRNQQTQKEGKFKQANRTIYCGAYHLTAKAVRELTSTRNPSEISSVEVTHQVAAGEIAHTDVKIVVSPNGPDLEGTKTAIIDRLWNACSGPLRHSCNCDRNVNLHPSGKLNTSPAGDYHDGRSRLCRMWYIIRFRLWCLRLGINHDPANEQP